jgi:hypothetical protein
MQTLSKKLEKEVLKKCGPKLEKGLTKEFLDCSKACYTVYKTSRLGLVRRLIFESRRELIKQTMAELDKASKPQ